MTLYVSIAILCSYVDEECYNFLHHEKIQMSENTKTGRSLLDTAINKIPFELHIPKVKNV